MAIYAPVGSKGQRELPEEGTYKGVCIGVWDLGVRDDDFQGKPKITHDIMLSWEIDQRMASEGEYKDKRFVLTTKKMALSFNEKSNLTAFVNTLVGKKLSEAERKEFNLENIKGMSGSVTISHSIRDGITYANIQSITPLMKGVEPITAETAWEMPPEWIATLIKTGHTIAETDSDNCKSAKNALMKPVAKEQVSKDLAELKASIETPTKSDKAF